MGNYSVRDWCDLVDCGVLDNCDLGIAGCHIGIIWETVEYETGVTWEF